MLFKYALITLLWFPISSRNPFLPYMTGHWQRYCSSFLKASGSPRNFLTTVTASERFFLLNTYTGTLSDFVRCTVKGQADFHGCWRCRRPSSGAPPAPGRSDAEPSSDLLPPSDANFCSPPADLADEARGRPPRARSP